MSSRQLFNMMVIATVIAFQTFLYAFDKEEGMWKGVMVEFEASTVLVGIDDPGAMEILVSILDTLSASVGDSISQLNIWILDIPDTLDVLETCEFLSDSFDVRWAEPNLVGYPGDDPYFDLQWNLKNSGQEGGTPGADIDIENAWAICRGSSEDTIAILDTGIPAEVGSQNLLHSDLDDANRFVLGGIWSGASNFRDCIGHGTLIAGIAGAETDNELFVAGTCPECVILIEKITNDTHFETTPAWFAWGICHAADAGSDVANFSWGFRIPLPMIEEAIAYAGSHQMLVTICSGNDGENNVWYPCDLSNTEGFENIICVGGTDRWDHHVRYWVEDPFGGHWQGPNFGPEIDIAGPYGCEDEIDVLSTFPPYMEGNPVQGLFYGEGTSYAAPHVAGVVGLIRSLNPNLTAIEVTEIIEESAEDVNADEYPGEDDYLGHGRLNAFGALLLTPTDGPKTLQADVNMGAGRTYGIVGNLVVPDGITMTINEGVHITMHPGSQIKVEDGGIIEILGTALDPVVFEAEDENDPWNGIKIYSFDEDNEFTYCDLSGATIGVRIVDGYCEFNACDLHDNIIGLALIDKARALVNTGTYIQDNTMYGVIIATNSYCHFNESNIQNNTRAGVWCASYGSADFDWSSVSSNGDGLQTWNGGIKSVCGTVDMYCSNSTNNNGPGIASIMSFIDLGYEWINDTNYSGANLISGNDAEFMEWDPGEIFTDMTWTLMLEEGHNSILDANEEHDLIVAWMTNTDVVNWEHNYWGSGTYAEIEARLPDNVDINPKDIGPTECDPEGDPQSPENPSDPDKLQFYVGYQLENLGQYGNAIVEFVDLIDTWPESDFAKIAADRIVFCEGQLDSSWEARREYFVGYADTTGDKQLEHTLRAAAAWCLVEMDDFEEAYNEFEALLDESVTAADSIKIAINMLMAELEDDDLDTIQVAPYPGFWKNMPELDQVASADRDLRIFLTADEILRQFNLRTAGTPGGNRVIPEDYVLNQNYPNPFNPTTTIRYGLPEAALVKITVYNVLGRKVATVVNDHRQAGYHKVLWDSRSRSGVDVSSGIYFYRIEANDFVDVKKMVLLR